MVSLYSGMKVTTPLLTIAVIFAAVGCLNAQDAADLLKQAEVAMNSGDMDRAFQVMGDAMTEAKTSKQTALYLRAANGVARLGLDRKINYESAFESTKDAARTVAFSAGDTSLATLYFNLARFYKADYQADEAIQYFEKAVSIYRSLQPGSLKEANCYHGLGDVYKFTVYDFQQAEEYYERALGIREKQHFADTIVLFNNYYGLAATNRSQDDFEKALSYGTVAVALSRSLNTVRQEFALSMIANIYRDMGDREEAERSYNEALRLNDITGNTMARASHFQNLAEAMLIDSAYDDALRFIQNAEQLYKKMNEKDERLLLHMLGLKASAYAQKKDAANFEKVISQIFAELKRTGRMRSEEAGNTYLTVAEYFGHQQKYYSAVDQCQLALVASIPGFNSLDTKDNPTLSMIGNSFNADEIIARKGEYLSRLYRATKRPGYLKEALACLYLAEQLFSEERNTLDTEDAKWAFLDTKYAVYESIVASLHESWLGTNDTDVLAQVFQFFERSKARSLADALAAAERARSIGANDSLLRVHGRLKSEILMTENRVSDLSSKGGQQIEITQLREHLVILDRQLQESVAEIEQKFPGYFNTKYAREFSPLSDIQSMLKNERRVILEYFWGSEWLYGLGISGDSVTFERIGKSDSVALLIDKLVGHLHNNHSTASPEIFQTFTSSSHGLYQLLIRPFESLLGTASLQIIPDGPVGHVPFEILLLRMPEKSNVNYRGLEYLIKSRSVGYAYSAAMLRKESQRVVKHPSLLAVGFTGGLKERAADDDMLALEEIEGAEKELDALALRFKDGRFLRDSTATESNFKSLSPEYDIIHLAIHGRADKSNGFSASLFFRSRNDRANDGVFHAYELYSMRLKASMAVLSACESGLGKDYRGEGMISMASAFTSAGCENTLMSLWKVNDQASIALMTDFYAELLSGVQIDEALRAAKLLYLERADEITADPKSWAPLVAYGSMHQIFEQNDNMPLLYLVPLTLLGGGVFIYLRRRKSYKLGGSRSPL
ncbi:CHAT domain-containing tetratricopeptide repeat protein [Chryseolinea sp. T2]|uniref:CHAT domain-containing protein n=1 Tax=Chryseolinea sp. T2 TaxID=3129255 RepID=UPI0030786AC1